MRGPAGRPSWILAMALTCCLLPSGVSQAASIRGVVLNAGPAPDRKQIPINIDQYVCGKSHESDELIVGPNRGIRWAVVSIQPPPPVKWDPPSKPVQMDQQQCLYVPRIVIVPVGGTVEFLNNDRLLHNLHSISSENATFNRTQPKGRTIPVAFQRPEIVRIDCELHSWMRGWIVVADHPFYALTGDSGEFMLPPVPAGKYLLRVWHETLGTSTREVTVGDQDARVTIELKARP